jgi:hypothetical protein
MHLHGLLHCDQLSSLMQWRPTNPQTSRADSREPSIWRGRWLLLPLIKYGDCQVCSLLSPSPTRTKLGLYHLRVTTLHPPWNFTSRYSRQLYARISKLRSLCQLYRTSVRVHWPFVTRQLNRLLFVLFNSIMAITTESEQSGAVTWGFIGLGQMGECSITARGIPTLTRTQATLWPENFERICPSPIRSWYQM